MYSKANGTRYSFIVWRKEPPVIYFISYLSHERFRIRRNRPVSFNIRLPLCISISHSNGPKTDRCLHPLFALGILVVDDIWRSQRFSAFDMNGEARVCAPCAHMTKTRISYFSLFLWHFRFTLSSLLFSTPNSTLESMNSIVGLRTITVNRQLTRLDACSCSTMLWPSFRWDFFWIFHLIFNFHFPTWAVEFALYELGWDYWRWDSYLFHMNENPQFEHFQQIRIDDWVTRCVNDTTATPHFG